jgi:plasmid stabilization system protein ParE
MSVRVRRSEWCLGDVEHYAAWYDREAGWELAQRYLRAVATSIEHLAENPESAAGPTFPLLNCATCDVGPWSGHFKNI